MWCLGKRAERAAVRHLCLEEGIDGPDPASSFQELGYTASIWLPAGLKVCPLFKTQSEELGCHSFKRTQAETMFGVR